MFPRLRRRGGDQRRMKRGLAVVQIALRHDADRLVGVQVNRVGIRRRAITAAPAHDLPRPGPEKVFPRYRGEGRLDPRVPDATGPWEWDLKRRLRGVEFPVALFDAADTLVPGNGGADMIWASALACSGDFLLRLTACQGKDLIAEAR
jgi:hypothetical protein